MAEPVNTPTRPSGPLPDAWPAQAADSIVRVVGQVRDRTTGPAVTIARTVVYGVFAAIVGVLALVLAIVLLVRLFGGSYWPHRVWAVYLVLGLISTLGGLFLYRKAASPSGSPK